MDIMNEISIRKIVPVIRIKNIESVLPLAEALCSGGLPVAEITFRTDAAEESIRRMVNGFPEMIVGAGSLTSVEQAKKAIAAGATFLVSAGFNRKVTEYAVDNNIPIFPGVCTPTEIMFLLEYNLSVAKFFPAEQFGGLKTIKALSAPFPNIKFMPTGGINAANILEYLSFNKIIACGGSWMVNDIYIDKKDFYKIQLVTAEAVALVNWGGLV